MIVVLEELEELEKNALWILTKSTIVRIIAINSNTAMQMRV